MSEQDRPDLANLGDYSFAPAATAEDAVHWALRAAGECTLRIHGKAHAATQIQKIADALLTRLAELGPTGTSAILDGADPTPVHDRDTATTGQMWHRLVTSTRDDREKVLASLLDASWAARQCTMAAHEGLVEELAFIRRSHALDRANSAARIDVLGMALTAAHPIVAYVSAGRSFVDVEPYPDGEARRVNAVIADLLDPPQQDGPTQ